MNWLILSYWIVAGSVAQDTMIFTPGQDYVSYATPPNTFEITLGAEFLLADHFFAGGAVETYETPNGSIFFAPLQSNYRFGFGIRYAGFELGWRHGCDHITLIDSIETMRGASGVAGTKTEVYISFKGSMKIF